MKKTYDSKFKSRVALEALRGELTIAEIASKYQIHPNQVQRWKQRLMEGASDIFASSSERKAEQKKPYTEGILRCKTLDPGLKKQREPASLTRFPALKQRSTGYLCSAQGTAETSCNPRTLRLLCRNKKACEIVGLHRHLKQNGGAVSFETMTFSLLYLSFRIFQF